LSPAVRVLKAGSKGFARGLALDLDALVQNAETGDLIHLDSTHPMLDAAVFSWCRGHDHSIVEKTPLPGEGVRYVLRLGGPPDQSDEEDDPAQRLWFYTNFHCNLACDYCCVRSSPRADPNVLDLVVIRRLAAEAPGLGFRRIVLTGGEPFLRPDIDEVVMACVEHLPTTVLTNAMLLEGPHGALLARLPRDRVTLQVSLDSPEPELHDAHRGPGSWVRAQRGIARARSLGFRVRVAATTHTSAQAEAMRTFLEAEGIPPRDRIVRPVALRGVAKEGVPLLRGELRPELTITTSGVYWHPVGATDKDFQISEVIGSLEDAVAAARELEKRDRDTSDRLAAVFHCT